MDFINKINNKNNEITKIKLSQPLFDLNKPTITDDGFINYTNGVNMNNIWVGSDWHLWKHDDDKGIYKNPEAENIIKTFNQTVKPSDLFIFCGDFVDGETTDYISLKQQLERLICRNMIMIKGNNDLFSNDFYKSCGFSLVVEGFKLNIDTLEKHITFKKIPKNLIFTHYPTEIPTNAYNIYGHMHGTGFFYDKNFTENNHLDVQKVDKIKPVRLSDLVGIMEGLYEPSNDLELIKSLNVINDPDKFTADRGLFDEAGFRFILNETVGSDLMAHGYIEMVAIKDTGYLNLLVVEGYRKQGLCVRLLNRIFSHVLGMYGISQLVFNVDKDNSLFIDIISKYGFKQVPQPNKLIKKIRMEIKTIDIILI